MVTQQHTLLLVGVCGRAARRRRRRHRRDNCGGHVCGPVSSARSVRWWLQLQPATTRDDRAGQPGGAHYDGLVSITRCCWSAYAGARLAADATACRGLCAAAAGRLQRSASARGLATKQHWRLLAASVGARLAASVGDQPVSAPTCIPVYRRVRRMSRNEKRQYLFVLDMHDFLLHAPSQPYGIRRLRLGGAIFVEP